MLGKFLSQHAWCFLTLLLPLVHTQTGEDVNGCSTLGRLDGQRYRVDCSEVVLDDLSSLDLPDVTIQLSIIGNERLTRIGKDDLSGLVNLDKLNLSGNAISGIEAGAFSNLPKLTKLDLSNNRLTSINNSMFAGLSQLKRLSLSGNLFSTLPDRVFSHLSQLTRIDFSSKNLLCDCHLKEVLKWIAETQVNVLDSTCSNPPTMDKTLIRSIEPQTLFCEEPANERIFELEPSNTQLVFVGDTLPIDCKVSKENMVAVYWYRKAKRVVTNSTAKIEIKEQRNADSTITKTLVLNQLTNERAGTWSCVVETTQANLTKSMNIVVAPAYCPEKTVETNKGRYKWIRTGFKSRAEQQCKSGAYGKAFYTCNEKGQWEDLDLKACKYTSQNTQLLRELSLADFNLTNNLEMVKKMNEMLMQSNVISDKMDIIFVAKVLQRISSSDDLYNRAEIPQMVYNTTSLMMNVNRSLLLEAEIEKGACTSMRESLETVVSYMLRSRSEFNLYMDNIAMQSRKYILYSNTYFGLLCTALLDLKVNKTYLPNNFNCVDQRSSPDFTKSTNQKVDALIHIPADLLTTVTEPNGKPVKLFVVIYRNDNLHPSLTTSSSSKFFVPSSVISATIIDTEVKDLSKSPITVALPRRDYVNVVPTVQAVYWDKAESAWSRKGCRISNTVELTNRNLSITECDHMTSYSLLQERFVPTPIPIVEVKDDRIFVMLRPQLYVGAVFLCICLIVIIFSYTLSYRTIGLSRKLKHPLINICYSILFLQLKFMIGIKSNHRTACIVCGMAIHYFSLVTIFWMTVMTWNIYKKISGRGHRRIPAEEGTAPLPPNPMLKFYLFAWGVPIIICGITGAVNINFYFNKDYCFVRWEPGMPSYYGVVALFVLINCILYIWICSSKHEQHSKVYMDEMLEVNADGCLEPHTIDDSMSNSSSVKSSVADSEYKPLAQLTGVIFFLILYLLMWASGAASIALPDQPNMDQMVDTVSYLYMILCIILGIFLVVFYCLARNNTRSMWHSCCSKGGKGDDPNLQPPRSNTNINIISHANAHNSLKLDDDSCSSMKTSSANNQSNPLLQIMQYHKKTAMVSHSVAGSQRADSSVQGPPDDGPVFFNPRQNGVAKKYWERKRSSKERGMNSSMVSVPETGRMEAHSPTNTEPTQHMSIEIQIKSHSSKQARRHRLGSTNSEPADVRNNIYHSMPKSPHQLHMPSVSAHDRLREPTIGQSKTSSEGSRDTPRFFRYPPDMWQSSVPRNYNHMVHRTASPQVGAYSKPPSLQYEHCDSHRKHSTEPLHKQSYVQGYLRSMRDVDDNSDEDSHYSHRSRRSSQRSSRQRHHRQRQHQEAEGGQPTPSAMNESHMSLNSHGTARSHHSSRSGRSAAHKHRGYRAEERPLLQIPHSVDNEADDEEAEKLNINHSSSDNNSSHYACAPVMETKQLNNNTDIQFSASTAFSPPQPFQSTPPELTVDLAAAEQLQISELAIPEERIYENAHKIMQHERPVYTNLEELRQRAAARRSPMSPQAPPVDSYELPVYENLFSLNEYDTLRKQKHHVNKGLPYLHQSGTADTHPLSTENNSSSQPPTESQSCDSSL